MEKLSQELCEEFAEELAKDSFLSLWQNYYLLRADASNLQEEIDYWVDQYSKMSEINGQHFIKLETLRDKYKHLLAAYLDMEDKYYQLYKSVDDLLDSFVGTYLPPGGPQLAKVNASALKELMLTRESLRDDNET